MDETILPAAFGVRFTLLRRIGAGQSGSTWLARDGERGDECVLKVLVHGSVPEGVREDLRREAENLRALSHPQVVRFREAIFDPARGLAAIAMDRVEGETLLEVAGHAALSQEDVLGILVACARGLGALHARGLVHRDLQPRNVVVTGAPGSRSAVLVDLGLAERRPRGMPKTFTGTLGFLAPEMLLDGTPDHRTDLYSLGAILYFMLTGNPPADPNAVLDSLLRGDDPFPEVEKRARERVPPPFVPLVGRLLARYPASRFQSGPEVIEAVNLHFGARHAVDSEEDRLPAASEPPFVGRTREMRAVLRRVAAAALGRGDALVEVRGGGSWSTGAGPCCACDPRDREARPSRRSSGPSEPRRTGSPRGRRHGSARRRRRAPSRGPIRRRGSCASRPCSGTPSRRPWRPRNPPRCSPTTSRPSTRAPSRSCSRRSPAAGRRGGRGGGWSSSRLPWRSRGGRDERWTPFSAASTGTPRRSAWTSAPSPGRRWRRW